VVEYRAAVLRGDKRDIPGAVRASAGLSTTRDDVERFLVAVADIASGREAPVEYEQDLHTGDYWPLDGPVGWEEADRSAGSSCARG
jgi:hypothetical protein